jgi:murein DD-endopeptidase MepM/ murein hydrolase activator NlpD
VLGTNPGARLRHVPVLCLIMGAAACAQSDSSSPYGYRYYHYTAAPASYSARPDGYSSFGYLQWPISEGMISSRFGVRHGTMHRGIDIAAPSGTPVMAAAAGEVIFAGKMHGYGKTIVLRHDAHRVTLYGHNRALWVKQGQHVRRGQTIATVGRSGHASGPNLHFEVRIDNRAQNPLYYLAPAPHLITFAKHTTY